MLVVSLSALLLWPLVDLGSDAWGQGPPPAPTEDRYRFPTHADARLAVIDFIEG